MVREMKAKQGNTDKQRAIEALAWLMLNGPKPDSGFGSVSYQSDEGPTITLRDSEKGWEVFATMNCGEVPLVPSSITSNFVSFVPVSDGAGTLFISRPDAK